MAGRKKYPDGFNDELWRLLVAGKKPKQIHELITGNDSPFSHPIDMSIRTIARRIAALKEERGEPIDNIEAGEEQEELGEIERASISITKAGIRRLQAKERGEGLTAAEALTLSRFASTIRTLKSPPIRSTRGRPPGNGNGPEPASSSVLDDMDGDEAVPEGLPLSEGKALLGEDNGGARQRSNERRSDVAPRSLASEGESRSADLSPAHA